MDALFEGGEDIRALATRVPSLYAESSNGRLAPRFYIRGLGNTDFDLAASQPVSIIVDEVVLENVILKSFAAVRPRAGRGAARPAGHAVRPQHAGGHRQVRHHEAQPGIRRRRCAELRRARHRQRRGRRRRRPDATRSPRACPCCTRRATTGSTTTSPARATRWAASTSSPTAGSSCSSRPSVQRAAQRPRPRHRRHRVDLPRQRPQAGQRRLQLELRPRQVSYDGATTTRRAPKGSAGRCRLDFDFDGDMTLTSITAYENTESSSLGDIDGGFGAGFPVPPPLARRALPAGQRRRRDPLHPVPVGDAGRHRRPRPVHPGVPPRLAGERPPVLAGGRLLLRLRVLRRRPHPVLRRRPTTRRRTRTRPGPCSAT